MEKYDFVIIGAGPAGLSCAAQLKGTFSVLLIEKKEILVWGKKNSMKIHYRKDNGPVDEGIQELIGLLGDIRRPEVVREMIIASLKW